MNFGIGFTRLTQANIVTEGKAWLYGWHIQVTADGGDMSLYEGMDADSGRLFGTFKALLNDPNPFIAHIPFYFDRGIYLNIGSNVTAVTIYWLPDPPLYVPQISPETINAMRAVMNG